MFEASHDDLRHGRRGVSYLLVVAGIAGQEQHRNVHLGFVCVLNVDAVSMTLSTVQMLQMRSCCRRTSKPHLPAVSLLCLRTGTNRSAQLARC